MDKIKVVGGDVTVDDLGISDLDNETLIGNVNLIFHCAANVRFDQSIKEAVNFNTAGTLRVLQLATKIKNFKVSQFIK